MANLSNGKPIEYNANSSTIHVRHIHAPVYSNGGLVADLAYEVNDTGKSERVIRPDDDD